MALRVLLADESPTIKKVMQISLQDFSIELKAVQLGIDVLQVAESFAPDIIFCDVLLQKKSGYDVTLELKSNPKTANIPVVLMWSGFMELDEEKFRECHADGHIEKPFDSHALRDIVKKLVTSTHDQTISQFLEFPEVTGVRHQQQQLAQHKLQQLQQLQEVPEAPPSAPQAVPPPVPRSAPQAVPPSASRALPTEPPPLELPPEPAFVESHRSAEPTSPSSSWTMDSFEELTHFNNQDTELDSFTQKPLQPLEPLKPVTFPEPPMKPAEPPEEDFKIISSRPIGSAPRPTQKPQQPPMMTPIAPLTPAFSQDLKSESTDRKGPQGLRVPGVDKRPEIPAEDEISHSELLANVSMHPSDLDKFSIQRPPPSKKEVPAPAPSTNLKIDVPNVELTLEQLEFIIRSQSKEIIEKIVWKLVPEIADRLIKDEIHRLMDETKL